ncbi:MAG: glycogen synthase [Elusimicrobia bacterium]|nr:glycogen synthase [Elusimicrobiota bacterium]
MKILLASSEAVPFCKTGGLADVAGTLGQKLGAAGHDVCLFLPYYRGIEAAPLRSGLGHPLSIPLGAGRIEAKLRYMQWKAVSVYFVDYPPFYDRAGLYGEKGKDFPDNDARFIAYSRAVLEGAKAVGFEPDVVHAHDWQAALICAYLKRQYRGDPFFARTAGMLTLHNMAYQGNFPAGSLTLAGFGKEDFTPAGFEYYGRLSFLKAGILCADILTTVSSAYAQEIQESGERGFGMEGILRERSADLHGVRNGLDLEVWNPRKDHSLAQRFGPEDVLEGKARNKAQFQAECGLKAAPLVPLVGIVSRLDRQKGLDLALAALEPLLERCQLAVLGSGDPALQKSFVDLARRKPGVVHFRSGFDDPFAHRLYASSDLFLMPSRFEPCGLGQMIAMRYGTLPVATRTGGLADTVQDGVNGFVSEPEDVRSLEKALDRALRAYGAPSWNKLVASAMSCDFSWDKSMERYLELYRLAKDKHGA